MATCDYPGCDSADGVTAGSIMLGSKEWDGDLCREHQAPFLPLLRPNRKKTDREKVWTMEEINALKR